MYVAWPRLVRNGGVLAYARKAVVSAFLDASRKRSSKERPTADRLDRASGEDVASAVADRAALIAALARLPGRQRACVVLRFFEELDVRKTAGVLGCSEGTVKSQTSRALASLRAMSSPLPRRARRDRREGPAVVNDLRELMRENVAAPPPDHLDVAGLVRTGRRRIHFRRVAVVGGTAVVVAAVVAATSIGLSPGSDRAEPSDAPPRPDAPTRPSPMPRGPWRAPTTACWRRTRTTT